MPHNIKQNDKIAGENNNNTATIIMYEDDSIGKNHALDKSIIINNGRLIISLQCRFCFFGV